jgi:hypothetical protein
MTARSRIILTLALVCGAALLAFTFTAREAPVAAAIAGCPMFPADNIWNARVDSLPVHAQSAGFVASIGAGKPVHPDFGAADWDGYPIGMFYAVVPGTQPLVAIHYQAYGDQSDPGPFPIPPDAPVEGGNYITNTGDRHVMVVDQANCQLYELFNAWKQPDNSWNADSGAMFTLTSNALRPDSWTSADAAGLPILPGLARNDEVATGVIDHALRFTVHCSQGYLWPARHEAGYGACATPPPLGLRFRLKAAYPITPTLNPQVKTILTALKQYGMFVADNSAGGDWYISGTHDAHWNDDRLVNELRLVHGSDFEAVDESGLMLSPDSGQVKFLNLSPAIWLPLIRH